MTDPTTPTTDLPIGALLGSALMAANYGGDSAEDVDRLIAELEKRGVRLATAADDDELLRSVSEVRANERRRLAGLVDGLRCDYLAKHEQSEMDAAEFGLKAGANGRWRARAEGCAAALALLSDTEPAP